MNEILVNKVEAARLLGLAVRTVENLVAEGQLRARRIGRRVLFERGELERFAKGEQVPGDPLEGSKSRM